MTLTIETTPELEEKLHADAERHGLETAPYVLQLLEQRYMRTPSAVPDVPTVGSRWRSASGLDADAIEDRRQSGAKSGSSHQRRSSRREEREQRRKTLITQVASIVVVVALLAGLVYAFIAYKFPRHVATHPPIPSRPSAALIEKKTNTAKPQADTAKPQADTAKPQADTAKPQADTAKPQADTAKPQADTAKPQADTAKPQADTAKPQTDHR